MQESIETTDGFEELATIASHDIIPMEIEPGRTLNINPNLSESQTKQLLDVLRNQK